MNLDPARVGHNSAADHSLRSGSVFAQIHPAPGAFNSAIPKDVGRALFRIGLKVLAAGVHGQKQF